MQNADIARLFDEVAELLEIQDANPFRVRAYRNAARTIRDFPEALAEVVRSGTRDLTDLPGIGEDLAEKITEIVGSGELKLRKQLAAKLPAGLLDLLRIPGLGPKRVKLLHQKLKVKSAADLAAALQKGKIQTLKGFGPKMEEKIRAGLGPARAGERRLLLHEAESQATALVAYLKAGGKIEQIEVAGSYRRRRETVGDLDVLVTASDSAKVMDRFARYPEVAEVVSLGETRATVKLRGGLQIDLRAVEPAAYGAALQYFTGSKAHNVELRGLAQDKKLKLNEYGLFQGTRRVAGATEAEIYAKLGLDWIPPELREARGEIARARAHTLPTLVELRDIRGDLQMHTSATDGQATIEEMAHAAREVGHEYIAITDHSKRVTMAHGLDPKRLREQWRTIDAWNARSRGLTILKSVEVDILESGKLDLAALARAAARAGCVLELNRHPERMDLPDTLAAAARQLRARFVLSTDSHTPLNLTFMKYAVDLARRAALEAGDILNTRPLAEFKKGLKRSVRSVR